MFNVGPGELIVIVVAALLLLGPKRLPEVARGLGKFLREFRRQTDEVRTVVEREFYRMDQEVEEPAKPAALAAAAPVVAPPLVAPVAVAVPPAGLAPESSASEPEPFILPTAPVAGTVARPRGIPAPPLPAEPAPSASAEPPAVAAPSAGQE